MKKLALTLLACLAMGPCAHAATSALTESLLEYEAITSAIGTDPRFENVIGPSEFIVDIGRVTRRIDITGTVKYEIQTRQVDSTTPLRRKHHCRNKHRFQTKKYIAILDVSPNPGIGPNIVTVVNIKPVGRSE